VNALALAAVVTSAWAAACTVDDRMITVKPEPIVLGTFESGLEADDPRFGAWSAFPSGEDIVSMRSSLAHDGCEKSAWCLDLDWQLTDVADGAPSTAGVAHGLALPSPVDVSGQARIVFDHQYTNRGACRAADALTAVFSCRGLGTAFQASLPLSSAWTTSALAFAALVESPGASAPGAVPREACLGAVSAILLQTGVELADGACASGDLLLDNVTLRGAP